MLNILDVTLNEKIKQNRYHYIL